MTEPTSSAGGPGREPGGDGDDPFAGLFRDQPAADPHARDGAAGRPPGSFGSDPRWGGPAAAQPWTPEPQRGGFGAAAPDAPGGPDGPGSPSYPNQPFPVNQPTQQVQRPLMHAETGINPIVRAEYPDEDDYRNAGWEPSGAGAQEPKRGKKKALVATGALGTVAVVAVAVVLLTQGGGASPGAAPGHPQAAPTPTPTVGFAPTGATAAENASQTAGAFFKAWEAGNFKAAANFTDDPAEALAGLQTYQTDLGASSVTITPTAAVAPTSTPTPSTAPSAGSSSGATATGTPAPSGTQNFSVSVVVTPPAASGASATTGASADPTSSATGSGAGAGATSGMGAPSTATWTYSSNLTAYQQDGRWYVKWDPSVLAPNLTSAEHLATVAVQPGAGKVTDASGGNLTSYSDPGIQSIVSYLKQHVPAGEGTPGIAVELVDSTGKAISGTEDIIKPAVNAASVATTIDPQIEQLALHAVQHKSGSSMVVIRPSTGAILAVANNDGGKDDALASREAPGSTMKIVTAAALFNYGVLTPESPVACPPIFTVQGVNYHNSEGDQEPAGTPFLIDFAQSCNNAFDSQYTNLENLRLEGTAVHTFGLNQPWNIGLGSASYFYMPTDSGDESGSELAQEAFGQGKVSASPLAMASVAATVQTGQFHQPYLLSSITDKVTEDPMPGTTQADLKKVMRAVISNPIGTAYGIPFASDVYGKTGTAEHGPVNMSPNAWFTAVDPNHDIAACALVLDNTLNQDNYGATNAAPEVLSVFKGL